MTLVSFSTVRWVNKQPQQSPTKTKRKEQKFSNWFNRVVSWSVKHNTPRKGESYLVKKVPRDESYDLPMVSRFPTIEAWLCSLLTWSVYLPTLHMLQYITYLQYLAFSSSSMIRRSFHGQ